MKIALQGFVEGIKKQILIEDGLIVGIDDYKSPALMGYRLIESDGLILPGFIDVHVHGGGGAETMDGSLEAYRQICQTHAKHGTTALLLTTITESDESIEKSLRTYSPNFHTGGAELLGFHIEGPFINPLKLGAQSRLHIKPPSVQRLKRWMELSQGTIRYLTMAPELDGATEVLEEAMRLGIVVSAGHSNASYQQACNAYNQGVQSTTHLFNAMSGLNQREPGLVGAALDTPAAYVELIADTYHVHPAVLRIAIREKGTDRIMLITDAVRAAGMPEGEYISGDQHITFHNGTVRLKDGTLAGSGLTLDRAVQNLIHHRVLDKTDVSTVTSGNQARLLGLPHGRLEAGRPANIVVFDNNWGLTHTFVRGELVYQR